MAYITRPASEFKGFMRSVGCKKRNVSVQAAEKVTLCDLNWSGGTKSTYSIFTLDGKPVSDTSRYSALAPWVNHAEGATIPLPQGFIIVRHGWFCGKESVPTIYVHPADMPCILPAY